ncbi:MULTISPECIES: hypothetical protein [Paenibacillus]|uniref:DUF4878 domain-containing protein n=1 Tax=Paenibacillus borealis TaxID=160799 RepID=A0ABX3HAK0_PAEBO|nr:hypothetical protein [Paenibacillus borealis]OMD47504.1 hypothetical protein BSK56_13200 [Paenibacillus borealis]
MKLLKKVKILTMSLLLMVTVVPAASASPSQSSSQVLEEATQVATDYFKSYISKDIEGRIQKSVEPSYANDTERRSAYILQTETDTPVVDFEIVNSTEVSNSEVDLSVQFTTVDTVLPPLPYEVKKIDNEWKVVLIPHEVNADQGSPDYGKVKPLDENTQYIDNSGLITARATMLDYYSFYNWAGNTLIGSDTFNTSNDWVSIMGYQEVSNWVGSTDSWYVKYEIITQIGGSVQWYGQKTIYGQHYTSNPQYYEIINLSTNRISNAKIRISSNGGLGTGSGNIYEN